MTPSNEQAYPPGTQCVITWASPNEVNLFSIGDVVKVDDWVSMFAYARDDKDTLLTDGPFQGIEGTDHCHRVAWMRPLEDPDKNTLEDDKDLDKPLEVTHG